ncbi:MAG: ergothioneine biosynthesis protein EgtB [Phycisphaerales bacterium JB060]
MALSIARAPLTGASLAERYEAVRAATDALRAPLSPEDCVIQSMTDASPTKWHLAHTTWFFEQFVLSRVGDDSRFDGRFAYLFNSYYTQVGDRQPRHTRGMMTRPSLARVLDYRAHVDERMMALLASNRLDDETRRITEIGLNHEQQHQELLLTDIRHALWRGLACEAYDPEPFDPSAEPEDRGRWEEFEAGLLWVGCDGPEFCYDNEQPRHKVYLPPFAIASRPVTCGQFIEFIEDGGYEREHLWLDEGAATVRAEGWSAPMYWEKSERAGDWRVCTMHGVREVDPSEPLTNISFFEAEAFARWAGCRLPTEFEWEAACLRDLERAGAHWHDAVDRAHMLERGVFHPMAPRPGPGQLDGMFGGAWEWTRSSYDPYPGYATESGALGEYNGKFMSGQYVLRGGSCATATGHIRPTYRTFFHPNKRWQFSGLRLAKDTA